MLDATSLAGEAVNVLIVEDDDLIRNRIVDALAVDPRYRLHAASTFTQAWAMVCAEHMQILLTDLQLPDGSGFDLIRRARQHSQTLEIMVISILGDESSVISAIALGANGYLLKDAFPADIAETVRELQRGHSPISASIARFIVRRAQSADSMGGQSYLNTAALTAREVDVLWGIAKGLSYADIATHLGISRQTVPGYIKSVYRKLEVHTRGEAVYEALQQGLIQL